MAVDFKQAFPQAAAAATAAAAGKAARADLPKAQFWINVGYQAEAILEGEDAPRFISLPIGIPVDTQEKLPTNSKNDVFAAMQSARNDLLAEILEAGNALAPGEERILNLQIQLRRVGEERGTIAADANPFKRAVSL